MKRISAVLLVLFLALGLSLPALAAGEKYTIRNPYANVEWDTYEAYKANLHTHTTFSDGKADLESMVEEYYRQGYDVIANADHGVVSKPWTEKPRTVFPLNVINIGKSQKVLSAARAEEISRGEGKNSENRNGRGMIQVPNGIELNAATVYKSHVVGLYGGWGYSWFGLSTDYRTPIRMTEKSGGVSIIAHPGDWIDSAADENLAREPGNVNFFADILRDYKKSCLGIEVYNGGDTRTRHDRILWDQLLMRLMPEGIPVWGFANDDSHKTADVGRTAEILFMGTDKPTPEDVRKCIESGAFLACSHRDNPLEIDGDWEKPFPGITKIEIAQDNTSITITADGNCNEITWITDGGAEVCTGPSVDLTDAKIKSYVRAQLVNDDGVTLTQPFGVVKDPEYRHPDDSLKGWEQFKWTFKMIMTKNVFGWLIENIAGLFD